MAGGKIGFRSFSPRPHKGPDSPPFGPLLSFLPLFLGSGRRGQRKEMKEGWRKRWQRVRLPGKLNLSTFSSIFSPELITNLSSSISKKRDVLSAPPPFCGLEKKREMNVKASGQPVSFSIFVALGKGSICTNTFPTEKTK